jgi:sterol O-acyltransferase
MKMHSYITVNGQLQVVRNESESLLTRLKAATSSVGGWDKALEVARDKLAEQQSITAPTSTSNTNQEPTPIGTPPVPEGLSSSYVDAKTANALRKRLTAISRARLSDSSISSTSSLTGEGYQPNLGPGNFPHYKFDVNGVKSVLKPGRQFKDSSEPTVEEGAANDVHENLVPHVLVYHPDEKTAALAHEYSELRSELVSSGPEYVTWPDTITWKNFAVYQLIPTLVYELEYPRTDRSVISLSRLTV